MLMLVLLLFPIGNKVVHELGHLIDEHCVIEGTHFCATEHSCNQCDYLSSTTNITSHDRAEFKIFLPSDNNILLAYDSNIITAKVYFHCLRGPPVC
mgnify:FL=1